jgi:IS30 family transposase
MTHFISGEGGVLGGTTPGASAWQLVPRGNKYFLLLVDDLSRYMWVVMIPSKDHAVAVIKDIQARVEGESGLKLKALRTDRGGEFTTT